MTWLTTNVFYDSENRRRETAPTLNNGLDQVLGREVDGVLEDDCSGAGLG